MECDEIDFSKTGVELGGHEEGVVDKDDWSGGKEKRKSVLDVLRSASGVCVCLNLSANHHSCSIRVHKALCRFAYEKNEAWIPGASIKTKITTATSATRATAAAATPTTGRARWCRAQRFCQPNIHNNNSKKRKKNSRASCGLCGKTKNITKTECCDNWIATTRKITSCSRTATRNHGRYILCGSHFVEGHKGSWKSCQACHDCETEMYVWYGTNEHNFEKLPNPPSFEPTLCGECRKVIHLGSDGYSRKGKKQYLCYSCVKLPMF